MDQQTIDKIAAGEVVERPASVVKELVENAIDAASSQITVEVKEGGIGFIRITDNGSGMEKDDIPLAFLRHSTSKIRSAEDLLGVASLGFRGEALSSISAVAMVELITKTRENALGSRCYLEGGVQKELEEIGAPDGTTFIVRNLFYNTPARKKFLKSEMGEAAAVQEIVTHLALSHPEISFKLIINNQMKLQTAGNGNLKDVIYHVYGRDVAMRMIQVEREEGPLSVSGFIGKPEISRGNRNYENYYINGRYVRSRIIAKGIEDGYKSFMMQHRYPFVCLNLAMDGKLLDVNVHPTKMELRFSNQNLVYDFLERTVREALSGRELIPEVTLDGEGAASRTAPPSSLKTMGDRTQKEAAEPDSKAVQSGKKAGETQTVPLEKLWRTPEPPKTPVKPENKELDYFMEQMRKRVKERHMLQEENGYQVSPQAEAERKPAGTQAETEQKAAETQAEAERKTTEPQVRTGQRNAMPEPEQMELFDGKLLSKEAAIRHTIIGQLFDTYWLVQYADKLYIIDQHAAHEKVLYERLMKSLKNRDFQSQLQSPPIVLNLNMQEEQLYLKYQPCFADMGFEIEEFGESAYAVRAIPANLPGIANADIFVELLDSLSEIHGNPNSETLLDKVASMSCKAAVKGKHQMSVMEARALIDELLTLENPYNCPHGRPTIISMTRRELEKKFKRIV